MVDDKAPGQPRHQEGGGGDELVGAGINVRFIVFEPKNLRANRLRREHVAVLLKDMLATKVRFQFGNLPHGPRGLQRDERPATQQPKRPLGGHQGRGALRVSLLGGGEDPPQCRLF